MKTLIHWLDDKLEEAIWVILLMSMTFIMGIQVFSRYVLGQSLSWSEEITRYLFIWCGFLSVSFCSKKCLSIKIEQLFADEVLRLSDNRIKIQVYPNSVLGGDRELLESCN